MPARNGERFVRSAIESILAGELRPSEIIAVVGPSTDGTADVVKSFAEVRYLPQEETGIAAAYNQGINAASSGLIAFLSCDDLWETHKLQSQVEYLVQHPEVDYCVGRVQHFLDSDSDVPPGFRRGLLDDTPVAYIMETLLARREVFDRVGLFDTSFEVAEDVDWFARARDQGIKAGVIDKVLVRKRVHATNASLNAAANNELLLKALRASIRRKRESGET